MKFRYLVLFLAFILVLSACTPTEIPVPKPDSDKFPPEEVIQEPTQGGEIKLALNLNNLIVDPLGFKMPQAPIYNFDSVLFRGLLEYSDDLKLTPDLASSYEINIEEKQVKITLKDNIKWEDGTSLTLVDVKYSLEWYSQRTYNGNWKQYTYNIEGSSSFRTDKEDTISGIIISIEENSITINYDQLNNKDLYILTAPILSKEQLSEKIVEEVKEIAATGKLLATGPYKIESLNETQWTLIRNDEYEEKEVYLDKLILTNYDENTDFQIIVALPQEVDKYLGSKKVSTIEGQGYQYLGMNLSNPVLTDISIRKAIALTIDYDNIIESIFQGYADQPLSTLHPKSWAYKEFQINYNIEEAKNLLDGKKINLELAYEDIPFYQSLAETISEQLSQVGISIELKSIPVDQYIPQLFSKGEFDLFIASWPYELDPINENTKWLSKNDVIEGGYNISHVQDETSDSILLNGRDTLDYSERKAIYEKWQDHFMNQYYIIPLASPQNILLVEPVLHVEMENSLVPYSDIQNWWIEK